MVSKDCSFLEQNASGSFVNSAVTVNILYHKRKFEISLLPVSPGMHCSGGVYLVRGGVPGPGECTWSRGVHLVLGEGVYLVLGGGGAPGPRGWCTWSRGGCTWSGGCTCQGTPPVDRHTPVNILPCPKLRLRAVKTPFSTNMLIGLLSFIHTARHRDRYR